MKWLWVKYVGGAYLLFIALKHWLSKAPPEGHTPTAKASTFWKTVILIELTDIAFAVDSILAAVAISKKLWVVITGGVIGLIAMRFAASIFIKLLSKFPNFEGTAYLLVFGVGLKLIVNGFADSFGLHGVNFHSTQSPAFWIFWAFVLVSIAYGFMRGSKKEAQDDIEALKKEEKVIEAIEK